MLLATSSGRAATTMSAQTNTTSTSALMAHEGATSLSDALLTISVRMGSIHSVKGKSVDGILVVESEIWKGSGADEQCIDLTTVLPRAFGVTDQPYTGVGLTAATNVFVGVTRPRELLGLALRKSQSATIVSAAQAQGWTVIDLTLKS